MALELPISRLPQDSQATEYALISQDAAPKMATLSSASFPKMSPTSTSPPDTAISEQSSLSSASMIPLETPDSASSDLAAGMHGGQPDSAPGTPSHQSPDVDPQILEALRSKDRLWVLKLGELMEGLINDRRLRIELSPSTSYQRLLVHRCSAYYKLTPENEPGSKTIAVCNAPDSRIPPRRVSELVPPEMSTQPAFKIMRRSQNDSRSSKSSSKVASVAGEEADLSDNDPSETGSLGGRSNTSAAMAKKRMTIEEREAAYNEARSRIFMDFEAKEKAKGLSASSSSASLASSSRSCGSSSVAGDLDDTNSSPATESEFSAPSYSREKKDRFTHRTAPASSSRPARTAVQSFPGTNTRDVRADSPSQFTYPNIYEPSQPQLYDPSQAPPAPPPHPGYAQPQYGYPYAVPPPTNPYYVYPYFQPYNQFASPPPMGSTHSNSDPSTPATGGDRYMHPSGYNMPYNWQQPPLQNPQMHQVPAGPPPPAAHMPPHNPRLVSPPAQPQFQQYMPPPLPPPPQPYGYPVPYYASPIETQHPTGPSTPYEVPRNINGGMLQPHHTGSSTTSMMSTEHVGPSNNPRANRGQPPLNKRGAPPMMNQGRGAWSYGPGVSQGGYTSNPSLTNTETIGPRLSTSRRQSNNSAGGNSSRSSNDEVSSTASSTSSTSRRTYTSTGSSQHPLPPRPDWAVGLKPQGRHHDSRNMSPMPPQRVSNGAQRTQPLPSSTEFPPLSSAPAGAERRAPAASGAWGNALRSSNDNASHATDDLDQAYQRPPPKSAELFNPKLLRRPAANQSSEKSSENDKDGGSEPVLVDQLESLSLQGSEEQGTSTT